YFLGQLEGERLSQVYASADVFVFPSLTDTFGNAILEAHASGLPAIVADRGGPQGIVSKAESGLIYPAAERDGLEKAMEGMLDTKARGRFAEAALHAASKRSWDAILDTFLDQINHSH